MTIHESITETSKEVFNVLRRSWDNSMGYPNTLLRSCSLRPQSAKAYALPVTLAGMNSAGDMTDDGTCESYRMWVVADWVETLVMTFAAIVFGHNQITGGGP